MQKQCMCGKFIVTRNEKCSACENDIESIISSRDIPKTQVYSLEGLMANGIEEISHEKCYESLLNDGWYYYDQEESNFKIKAMRKF